MKENKSRERFKPGDVFYLELPDGRYAFGRCISKVSIGHIVEIFNYFSDKPVFDLGLTNERLFRPIPLDSWSVLRCNKRDGNWKVIGHDADFVPTNMEDALYVYGTGPTRKVVNYLGQIVGEVSSKEVDKITIYASLGEGYMYYSPRSHWAVLELITRKLDSL